MGKVKVDKDVFEALNVLKHERTNPIALLCYKALNNEVWNSGELKALNKITYKCIYDALEFGFELKNKDIPENKILMDVSDLLVNQTLKGLKKYGEMVKAENLTTEQWIDHASEEIIDTLVYLQCIKQSMKERIKDERGDKS